MRILGAGPRETTIDEVSAADQWHEVAIRAPETALLNLAAQRARRDADGGRTH